jgi:type I restriction enzyme, S subunit
MLPEGWKRSTVGEDCAIKNYLRLPLSSAQRASMQGDYPYFGPTGVLGYLDHYRIDEEIALIGEDGDHFLKHRDREMTLLIKGKSSVNNHAHVVGSSESCLAKWFYYWFMHRDITPMLSRQGVGRYKLTKAGLEGLEIWLPPVSEQKKIARALAVWDIAITTTEKLLANSRQQKQMLMRGLLSGKRRFGHPQGTWQYLDFDELFERVTRKNKIGNTNVLTISGQNGLINQREYFNKRVASENLAGYTLLERYEFAYNKSYSAGYPMGAIKPLLAYDAGVVSSLYICFRIKDDVGADFHFFRHYFEAGLLNEEISGIAQEGARNHGLLNVGVGDFFKLRLHVPSLPVQRKIAEAINAAEAEERLFEYQLERFQIEKRALMQQLLTGKRRVKLDEPAAEASAA